MAGYFRDWWEGLKPVELAPVELDPGKLASGPASASAAPAPRTYSADQPITSRDQDRFNRWPFAKRIADTIANGRDPSSLVVGLYGAWGDGKTSTLGLMQQALAEHSDVILLRFNPWQFASENQLLRGFFDSLADALRRSLATHQEEVGRILEKYTSILSLGSAAAAPAVKADATPREPLSSVELQHLRVQLERILQQSCKRVVILVDDIDRLDRSEIHTTFKLVKLLASFEHTSYVLAFDDEMVAAALGEKYGGVGLTAGRSFLEKIIHVPLHLPPAETVELRKIALEGVAEALTQNHLDLTREQIERFTRTFVDAFEPQLQTPRQAKRFANSISFALPLLQGEADLLDVILVEATRVCFPRLYTAIRDHRDVFLLSNHEGRGHTNPEMKKRLDHLVTAALEESGISDKETIRRQLIEVLFPRSGRTEYGDNWDLKWSMEQRVCSEEYFERYFSYGVPPGDIGDVEVRRFVDDVRDGSIAANEIKARLMRFSERRAVPRLLSKLRYQEETIDSQAAQRIALALATNGALLPKEEGTRVFGSTFMQGAILIRQLLKRVPPNSREELALRIAQTAEPLSFAAECFRFMRFSKHESPDERILRPQSEALVGKKIASRVYDAAPVGDLYASFGTDTPELLWVWKNMGLRGEMEAHLRKWLNESVRSVDTFVGAFVDQASDPESGLPRRSEFRRDSYHRAAELINAGFIVERLRAAHGDRLQEREEAAPHSESDWERYTARQFIALHDAVLAEKHKAANSGQQRDAGEVVEVMAPAPEPPAAAMPTLSPQPWTPAKN